MPRSDTTASIDSVVRAAKQTVIRDVRLVCGGSFILSKHRLSGMTPERETVTWSKGRNTCGSLLS